MLYALPDSGWRVEVEEEDADRIDIEFRGAEAESKISARCRGGAVDAEVE